MISGAEAIDTLLPRLENDRGKFLAIAAGYPDQMQQFLNANPGMHSRFTTRIEFFVVLGGRVGEDRRRNGRSSRSAS